MTSYELGGNLASDYVDPLRILFITFKNSTISLTNNLIISHKKMIKNTLE